VRRRLRSAPAIALLLAGPLAGQAPGSALQRVQMHAELGTEAELYGISGREGRRPGQSARVFFTPTFTYKSLSLSLNLLLSTENGSTAGLGALPGRQRLNQIGIVPRWAWGKAYLGSFSDNYTPLTWSGVRVDGAGFELNPGLLRFGIIGGSSRQPVLGGATTGSFGRRLAGGKLGVGRKSEFGGPGTFLDVVFLRVWDDPSSLPPGDSLPIPINPDSVIVEPDTALLPRLPIDPYAVTPQENAVLATSGGLSLLGGAVAWSGEVAGSVYSRDRRAEAIAPELLGGYPGIFRSLVTPRSGTSVDYAYRSKLEVRIDRLPGSTPSSPRSLTASIGYESTGPGYVSLGTAFLPNDIRGVELRTALRTRRMTLQLDGARSHDNLAGQKLATTFRGRSGITLILQPLRAWHAMARLNDVSMTRDVADSVGAVDYSALVFNTSHSYVPATRSWLRGLTLSYTFQRIGDDDPSRAGTTLRSHSAEVRAALGLSPRATLTPALGLVRARTGLDPAATRATYSLAGEWRSANRRLVQSVAVSRSEQARTRSLSARVSSRFQLNTGDALSLVVRLSQYRSVAARATNFDERVVSLGWARQI